MNETDKLIEEQLKILPPNLQRAINAVPWKSLVQEVGKANVLDTEQIVSLEQETMFIIYGFENPRDYISNLTREVGLNEIVAADIADSVGEKILKTIDEEARKEVMRKPENNKSVGSIPASVLEIPPANLPMVAPTLEEVGVPTQPEAGVGKEEQKPKVPPPDYRYDGGKDPYREPLQ